MKDQINTIRSFIRRCADGDTLPSFAATEALTALAQIEAAVGEPVATVTSETGNPDISMSWWHEPALPVGTKLYAAPVAQQYEAGDVASAAAQGFREGVASVDKQPQAEAVPSDLVCDKDPQGCWNVRCQLGKVCKNAAIAQQKGQQP